MKILCSITFHGYGHLVQSACVLNRLKQLYPACEVVLQCAAPNSLLQGWFDFAFIHEMAEFDIGIPMRNAVRVDTEQTWQHYVDQLQHHRARVEDIKKLLCRQRPDLVLGNVSHLVARAAAELHIPCLMFCSLNWADTLRPYLQGKPLAEAIMASILDDYQQAQRFYCLSPGMPMTALRNRQTVGLVCRLGQKLDLAQRLQQPPGTRFALVSLGGMPYPIAFGQWQLPPGWCVINGGVAVQGESQLYNLKDMDISHLDALTSCDVLVCKPGYGMFAEAAGAARPILYVPRADWPEESHLLEWQRARFFCEAVTEAQLQQGDLLPALERAWRAPQGQPVPPTGIDEIVAGIGEWLWT